MFLDDQPKLGLRERKKLKTRETIQQNAVRLFRDQGYQETTIEQIADQSDVSPSTVFRYFPTKEAIVLQDEFDPLLMAYYRKQPPELSPIQAFRRTVKEASEIITAEERRAIRERTELIMSVPELRAANMSQYSDTLLMIAGLIAERVGRESEDLVVLGLAGSIVGAILGAHIYCSMNAEADYVETIERTIEQFEEGFQFQNE
ncbi:acyl-CoA-like ligand-binding transcription factor [Cohnella cholangitidis]|uniref:TetR family transcriptional regulator n=1 Tax=Cohnella cholangitidis TaxID=2598458 RepID=A0A7G5C5Q6_9BACL|nr:TetR family transcriptional regulator [Cohnella cholangitidis]QMV44540.1 TetR family transcriptional regulator [Cohnella cholangitidis]